MFKFDPKKVDWRNMIAKGGFGCVYPYNENEYNNKWVVKVLEAKDFQSFLEIMQKAVVGFNLDHSNVLPVRGFYAEELKNGGYKVYLKLKRMKGSLAQVIERHTKNKQPIPEKHIIWWFYGLTCGLEYLHSKRIAHRDIKPENILIEESRNSDQPDNVKFTDVGIARFTLEGKTSEPVISYGGTQAYMAPEMETLKKSKREDLYNADMWSLGITILKLCLPKLGAIRLKSSKQEVEAEIANALTKLKETYSQTLIDTLATLLKYDPKERVKAEELVESLLNTYPDELGLGVYKATKKEDPTEAKQRAKSEKTVETLINTHPNELELEASKVSKPEDPTRLKEQLNLLKQELEQNWKETFNIKIGEEFDIEIITTAFSPSDLNNQDLKSFTDDLITGLANSNIKSLEALTMDLSECENITDQDLITLAAQLSGNLNTLQSLNLNFSECENITDQALINLANQLNANFKALQSLSLNFSGCEEITDQALITLANQISANLKSLQSLTLNFSECGKITDQALITLTTQISANLKTLQSLTLDFSWCENITDQALTILANQLSANLRNIQSLTLDFSVCGKITDQALTILATQLSANLKTLQSLTLNFLWCENITDQGLNTLANQLSANLKNLQGLSLNFSVCNKITDQGLTTLANQLSANLKNLQDLTLDFSRSRVTQESIKSAAAKLAFILHLKINV